MKRCCSSVVLIYLTACISLHRCTVGRSYGEEDLAFYRERVVKMFQHAYDGYIKYAYPYDELRPLTCDGHDTWGSFSLTLIDALDTLAVMGNYTEFQRVAQLLIDEINFDIDINASVFETNIRVIGGLLSAHLFSRQAGLTLEPGWPCSGPLLRMAENVARRLLPAFNTTTGMPYGTVNLKYGVPNGETTVTCTAGVGTYIVEFGALSRLTGDPVFEETAMRALRALWDHRSAIGLVGNHIDVMTGKWTATEGGIGGGVDSYFEYLVKGAVLLQNTELLQMYRGVLETYIKRDDWYMWANMKKGGITLPVFQSLDAFWPGMQSLLGDIDKAMKTIHNFHQVWRQFGFTPEIYNIPKGEAHQGREGYPLRPELVESAMYLYRATNDPYLLEIGIDALEAIEHSTKTRCGFATVKDVTSHSLENRMESFFLAETTKYLYLLFSPDHFIHNTGSHGDVVMTPNGECILNAGGYIFNTEAHPVDMAATYCCSVEKKNDDRILQDLHDNLDLLTLLDVVDPETDIFAGATLEKRRRKLELKAAKSLSQSRKTPGGKQESQGKTTESLSTKMPVPPEENGSEEETDDKESGQHYLSLEAGLSVSGEDSLSDSKEGPAEIEVLSTSKGDTESDKQSGGDSIQSGASTVVRNEKLIEELSSKLSLDLKQQFSSLVESLQVGQKLDKKSLNKDTPAAESNKASTLDSSDKKDCHASGGEDGENVLPPATQTITQQGEWIQIKTHEEVVTTPLKQSGDEVKPDTKTKNLPNVNSQVQELAAMIKSVLSSNSEHVFSGNSGFSFGSKTTTKTGRELDFQENQPEQLVCRAQPFHMRLSVMGEMFEE